MSIEPLDSTYKPTNVQDDGWVDPFYRSPPTGKVVEGQYGDRIMRIMKNHGEWCDEHGKQSLNGRPTRWRLLPEADAPRNACTWKAPLVTLATGEQVPSDSQAWLLECEARHILNMPTKAARLELLDQIEKRRGADAAKELRERILLLWELQRGEPRENT